MGNKTRTRLLAFRKLARDGKSGALVAKLMLACMDIQMANDSLTQWTRPQPGLRAGQQRGARLYFCRLQFAHLFEALKIVQQIEADPRLRQLIAACDEQTRQSFASLLPYAKGGPQSARIDELIGRLRHTLVFHYDESGKQFERAIAAIAAKADFHAEVTRGNRHHLWNFEPAAWIVDQITARQQWGIPDGVDTMEAADRIIGEITPVMHALLDFAGELLWRYASKGA